MRALIHHESLREFGLIAFLSKTMMTIGHPDCREP
jgi:hypothetical protein